MDDIEIVGLETPYVMLSAPDTSRGAAQLPMSFRLHFGSDWRVPVFRDKPYVYSNFAASRDGRVSYNEPGLCNAGLVTDSHPHDRWLMGLLRARADAVMIGDSTIKLDPGHIWTAEFIWRAEAAAFNALRAAEGRSAQPLLVIISYDCTIPADEPCINQPDVQVLLVTTSVGHERGLQLKSTSRAAKMDVLNLGDTWVDLAKLTRLLRSDYGVKTLLCEGGPRVMGGMLQAGMIDEEFLTYCPKIVGAAPDHNRPSYIEGVAFMPDNAPYSRIQSLRSAGDYLFLQTRVEYRHLP